MKTSRLALAAAALVPLAACRAPAPAPVLAEEAAPAEEAPPPAPLSSLELAELDRAEDEHPELAELAAGDLNLSERELKIIGLTALAVIVIVLLV